MMSLRLVTYIDLPAHVKPGGFDHAAVHGGLGRLYVAHTANDALDVVDCQNDQYLHSIPDLTGVAGALVSEENNLIFTSNRGENTVGIFAPDDEAGLVKIPVGMRPNGLAYDLEDGLLLAAHVGDPADPDSFTVCLIDVKAQQVVATVAVPGRTRWTIYDRGSQAFYVNVADPAVIVVIEADTPSRIARTLSVPAVGPHGLDLDTATQSLFCACDDKRLICLDMHSGKIFGDADLSGAPDVIFFNVSLQHLYAASGDPGVIDVFDTRTLKRIESIPTEAGAHTIAFDGQRNKVYAFLPRSHRAAVYADS
jgi:DNA-binding beta-propeller fold protein YncE